MSGFSSFFLSFLSFSFCFFLFLHYFCVCITVLLCDSNTSSGKKKRKKSIPQILICFDLNPSPSLFSSAALEELALSACRSSLCDSLAIPVLWIGKRGALNHLQLPSAFSQAQLEVQWWLHTAWELGEGMGPHAPPLSHTDISLLLSCSAFHLFWGLLVQLFPSSAELSNVPKDQTPCWPWGIRGLWVLRIWLTYFSFATRILAHVSDILIFVRYVFISIEWMCFLISIVWAVLEACPAQQLPLPRRRAGVCSDPLACGNAAKLR